MSLSQEVLDTIAFAEKMGLTKLHLQPPAVTREALKTQKNITQSAKKWP